MAQPEEHIPEQQTGAESNTVATQQFATEAEARQFYGIVRQRLLQVNQWHDWAGTGTAEFRLTDAAGNEVAREPQAGDHFRIDIPGPGSITGDGYDWVRIEAVEETHDAQSDCLLVQVRPATNPQNEQPDVAHFFSEEATSNFLVKREGLIVSAGVHGRNEKPNTHTNSVVDKVRNATVATGAVSALSKLQWRSLVNGLVRL